MFLTLFQAVLIDLVIKTLSQFALAHILIIWWLHRMWSNNDVLTVTLVGSSIICLMLKSNFFAIEQMLKSHKMHHFTPDARHAKMFSK